VWYWCELRANDVWTVRPGPGKKAQLEGLLDFATELTAVDMEWDV